MSESQEFDHRVEIRDPRTGQIVQHQPYVLHIGPGKREYERPPGSGVFFDSTGAMIRDDGKEKREAAAKALEAKKNAEKAALLAEVEQEKQAILDAARKEADDLRRQLVADAQVEAEAIKAEAKSEVVEKPQKGK